MAVSAAPRPGARLEGFSRDIGAAFPAWLAARGLVAAAIAVAHEILARGYRPPIPVNHHHPALLDWDADWYRRIAVRGYAALPRPSLRFFPLWPLLARWAGRLPGQRVDLALIALASALALVFGALVHRLALTETGDPGLARRATWLAALAPPAFVLVMGYSESLALCLSAAGFLAVRRRRWGWAALAGLLAGLCRPVGALLCIPIAIEAVRARRSGPGGGPVPRTAAVLSPLAGTGIYLGWVWHRFGDAMLPFREQQAGGLRGHLQDPVHTVLVAASHVARADFGRQWHYPWVLAGLALALLTAYRLPASYSAYSAAIVLSAISSQHLGSLERYLYAAFPVAIALAAVLRRERWWYVAAGLAAAAFTGYAVAAFSGAYVP